MGETSKTGETGTPPAIRSFQYQVESATAERGGRKLAENMQQVAETNEEKQRNQLKPKTNPKRKLWPYR